MTRILITLAFIFSGIVLNAQQKDLEKLYSKEKYDLVIEKGLGLLKTNNDDPDVSFWIGRSYVAIKAFSKSIPLLEKASKSSSKDVRAWALACLGKSYFCIGNTEIAIQLLKECINSKGSRAAQKYAQNYLNLFQNNDYYNKWELQETSNIRYHFQDLNVITNSEEYKLRQEKNYKRIVDFFGSEASKKIDVFVWSDQDEAYRKLGRPLGFSNSDLCTVNVFFDADNDYELCNMLVQMFVHPRKTTMIIKQGLAVYFDQMDKNLFQKAGKSIPEDRFYVLELWEQPTKYERDLSYPVGGALIEFLINKGGKKKLMEFLKTQTIEHAKEIYPDFENWMKTFESMLMR